MRLRLADGRALHLGYCFNVLPGETAATLREQLSRFCAPLRQRLGVDRLGVGLWIAHGPARVLAADPDARRALGDALDSAGLYVFTLNGFPYGGFHAPRVKEKVFLPGWADSARRDYTIDLGNILADLIPDDVDFGSISTVPLGPRDVARDAAAGHLAGVAEALAGIAERTGRVIKLGLEPEPGAAEERAAALAEWLAARCPSEHLGICFDCCHAAVVEESSRDAWASFARTGVGCSKVQVSSALVVPDPADQRQRARLREFDEPRFLHQVRLQGGGRADGGHEGAMDLPEALSDLDRSAPWRVHFHVPVYLSRFGLFSTTAASIAESLSTALGAGGDPPHIEVETYTWSVLPEAERPVDDAGLIEGMAEELRWTIAALADLGATS